MRRKVRIVGFDLFPELRGGYPDDFFKFFGKILH